MPSTLRAFVHYVSCGVLSAICAGTAGCASTHDRAQEARLAALSGPHVVTFKVEGMACRNCANEIAHELEDVPGVRAAVIDFDSATARVALDPDPKRAATMLQLHAAVEHWRAEHFSVKDDPNCLDPVRREELQRSSRPPGP